MAQIVTHLGTNYPWIAYRNGHNQLTITLLQSAVAFDISTYTFVVNIRKFGDSTNVLQLTQGSGVTNGGATGILSIDLTVANILASLPGSDYFYEIAYTKNSKVYALFEGALSISSELNPGSATTAISSTVNLAGTSITANITLAGGSGTITEIDGGSASSVYTLSQILDGEGA